MAKDYVEDIEPELPEENQPESPDALMFEKRADGALVGKKMNGTFAPGFSGNPGGRPAMATEVKDFAKSKAMTAAELAYRIMMDENEKTADRLAAIRYISQLAGVMVNAQKIQVEQTNGDQLKDLSNEELLKLLKPPSDSKN